MGSEDSRSGRLDAARSRGLKFVGLLLLVLAILAVAGCGGDDGDSETVAVCDSLETLSADVDGLQDLDLESGEGAVADLEEALDTIQADLETVKADAAAELATPLAGLESSLDALVAEFAAVQAVGEISAASAQSLLDSLAAVSTSWETLKSSAPDCDL